MRNFLIIKETLLCCLPYFPKSFLYFLFCNLLLSIPHFFEGTYHFGINTRGVKREGTHTHTQTVQGFLRCLVELTHTRQSNRKEKKRGKSNEKDFRSETSEKIAFLSLSFSSFFFYMQLVIVTSFLSFSSFFFKDESTAWGIE